MAKVVETKSGAGGSLLTITIEHGDVAPKGGWAKTVTPTGPHGPFYNEGEEPPAPSVVKSMQDIGKLFPDIEFTGPTVAEAPAFVALKGKVGEIYQYRGLGGTVFRGLHESMTALGKDMLAYLYGVRNVVMEDIGEILEAVAEQSQVYCPWITGALRNSMELVYGLDENVVYGEIVYARTGIPIYAEFVHEQVSYKHKPPTQSKFLEKAWDEKISNVIEQIYRKYSPSEVVNKAIKRQNASCMVPVIHRGEMTEEDIAKEHEAILSGQEVGVPVEEIVHVSRSTSVNPAGTTVIKVPTENKMNRSLQLHKRQSRIATGPMGGSTPPKGHTAPELK